MKIPLVFACALLAGCGTAQLPTMQQVELNIPANVRVCPNFPVSPGAKATRRQTAQYIVKLYYVAKACKANIAVIDKLYVAHGAKVKKLAGGK